MQQPQNSAGGVENRSLIRPLDATRQLLAEPLLNPNGTQARWQKAKVNFAKSSIQCPPASVQPEKQSERYWKGLFSRFST